MRRNFEWKGFKKMGFKNIKLLKHGETIDLNELKLTIYQFGLFLNDSAMVIENQDIKLLNANDCKIAGASLRQIIKKYNKIKLLEIIILKNQIFLNPA